VRTQRRSPNAYARFRARVEYLLEQERLRPTGARPKNPSELAKRLKLARSTLSELLQEREVVRGPMAMLDDFAKALGVPASDLVKQPDTAMVELEPGESRAVRTLRTLSHDAREALVFLLDYFGTVMPEEPGDREAWVTYLRLKAPMRAHVRTAIAEAYRKQRTEQGRDSRLVESRPTPSKRPSIPKG
jgi:transcriptional regulator with XRE-family HTH domain